MSVRDFYKGKHIFVTGGSGFLGKVLIEKLLRSCDGIEKIYLLIRGKKGKSPQERLQHILNCPLFEKLAKANPDVFKKLVPVIGNVAELKLGLSDEDIQTIVENVDIIYHSAASVKFDDFLKDSILLNVRGTRELVKIALQAKKSVVLVHVSTAYCNCDKNYLEEKIYPAHADWRDSIKVAEELDQHSLNVLSEKYIHPFPNTYVFAKSLGEQIVNDLCKGKILTAIVRPSIVVPSVYDPITGWIDNFNGPVGLLAAGGKGVLKVCYGDVENIMDYIPVDTLIKMIILLTYEKAISADMNEVSVYHATTYGSALVQNQDLITLGSRLTWDAPYQKLIWYPSFVMTNNSYKYYAYILLYHLIPGVIVDGLLKLFGKKPMLVKLHRKIYVANTALVYFMRNSFEFINHKTIALYKHLKEPEREIFSFFDSIDASKTEIYAFYLKAKIQTGKFLFNDEFDIVKGFRRTTILWILDILLHVSVFGLLAWCLIAKVKIWDIFSNLASKYETYLREL